MFYGKSTFRVFCYKLISKGIFSKHRSAISFELWPSVPVPMFHALLLCH